MQKELRVRKNIRLKGYDYSRTGHYFITICVKDRHEMLGCIDAGTNTTDKCDGRNTFIPTEYADIVEKEIAVLENTYDNVTIDKYVIMPNHIHMIVTIKGNSERTQDVPTISRIVKQFKGSVTKQIGFSLWQPRFYDEIIRDKEAYHAVWRYIEENPQKWTDDDYFVKPAAH